MRIAFVSTVRNEEDLIAANIQFHSFIGGTDFCIYIDDSTDRTAAIARTQAGVRVRCSRIPRHCANDQALGTLTSKFQTHHTARQILNCYDAVEWGRANHVDWLVSLDPDEIVCLDRNLVRKDMLAEFLAALPRHVSAVTFPTLEVIPTRMESRDVFRSERWFKRNYGFGEGMRYQSRCDTGQNKSNNGVPGVEILDPLETTRKWTAAARAWKRAPEDNDTPAMSGGSVLDVPYTAMRFGRSGRALITDWYSGHVIGKQAFRLDRNLRIANLHKVVADGQPECVVTAGCLLHYNNYSAQKFILKYRQSASHPDTYSSGYSVDPQKLFLRDLVKNPKVTRTQLIGFYRKHFIVDSHRLAVVADLWPGAVERVDAVADFFQSRRRL